MPAILWWTNPGSKTITNDSVLCSIINILLLQALNVAFLLLLSHSLTVRPKFLYITVVTCIDCRHSLSLLFALIGEWNGNQWCLKSKKGMRRLPLAFLILPPARKVTWRYVLHSAFTNGDPGVHQLRNISGWSGNLLAHCCTIFLK